MCLSEQDVVRTGSALLAPDTQAAWEQIQRGEAGAVQLLKRFEAYFGNVARNVRRTYLRPFVVVTANMSKGAGRPGARCAPGVAPAGPSLGKGHQPCFLVRRETGPPSSRCVNRGDAHVTLALRESGAAEVKRCRLDRGGPSKTWL